MTAMGRKCPIRIRSLYVRKHIHDIQQLTLDERVGSSPVLYRNLIKASGVRPGSGGNLPFVAGPMRRPGSVWYEEVRPKHDIQQSG